MIVSVSRRTDIPAFYMTWFMNRLRAGSCVVPHPFRPSMDRRVSLKPEDVDALVFWTRHAGPLLPCLDELDRRGYRCVVLYTVLDYPRLLEPAALPLDTRLRTFRRLADRLGPDRVVWRYDPLIFSRRTDAAFHRATFHRLAEALSGTTRRCILSLLTPYRTVMRRLAALEDPDLRPRAPTEADLAAVLPDLVRVAGRHGMAVASCASETDLRPYGVPPGACVDGEWISEVCGVKGPWPRDPGQRPACRCALSVDVGAYDTCLFGCRYCYATRGRESALRRFARHDPQSERQVPDETTTSGEVGDEGGLAGSACDPGESA